MKRLFTYPFYLLFFCVALIALLPKQNIYYFALENLSSYKVELSQQSVNENRAQLNIKDMNINYNGIDISKVSDLNIVLFGLYNKIQIRDINIDKSMSIYVPQKINDVSVEYSILDPLKINMEGRFNLGSAVGYVDLVKKIVKIELETSKSFERKYFHAAKYLEKQKSQGDNKTVRYTYEYRF